jgi:hypothetical protein
MEDGTSRIRQRLAALEAKRARQLELALDERGPLIRGSFGTRARVCGSPACRCAAGELHESKYLSASVGGRTRQVHVPAHEEVAVAAGVERRQRFRRIRAEIAALSQEQLSLLDALGDAMGQPYPPDEPVPPAGQRGRKPRKRREAAR